MKEIEVLKLTRDRIAKQPELWIQNSFQKDNDKGCLVGQMAISASYLDGKGYQQGLVNFDSESYRFELDSLIYRMKKLINTKEKGWGEQLPPWSTITLWNDAKGRTVEEVIDLLDVAIKYFEELDAPAPAVVE